MATVPELDKRVAALEDRVKSLLDDMYGVNVRPGEASESNNEDK